MTTDPVGISIECLIQSAQGRLYRSLPLEDSKAVRLLFALNLPKILTSGEATHFFSLSGMLLARGHRRVVIGDHGAYVEFTTEQIVSSALKPKFCANPRHSVKYLWYVPKDGSEAKVYHQQDTVPYADYRVGCWYISPRELLIV